MSDSHNCLTCLNSDALVTIEKPFSFFSSTQTSSGDSEFTKNGLCVVMKSCLEYVPLYYFSFEMPNLLNIYDIIHSQVLQ